MGSGRAPNPGTPVFAHYTSARRWYAPRVLAKVNNSEIERETEIGIKKKIVLIQKQSTLVDISA